MSSEYVKFVMKGTIFLNFQLYNLPLQRHPCNLFITKEIYILKCINSNDHLCPYTTLVFIAHYIGFNIYR